MLKINKVNGIVCFDEAYPFGVALEVHMDDCPYYDMRNPGRILENKGQCICRLISEDENDQHTCPNFRMQKYNPDTGELTINCERR